MAARWTDPWRRDPAWVNLVEDELAAEPAFASHALRPATRDDEAALFELHRAAMREHVEAIWGWNEDWQRAHFAGQFAPARTAVIVRRESPGSLLGRLSLSQHWRKIFLRDIELAASERNFGLGSAMIRAVIAIARRSDRYVELRVLRLNPAQRLYARLGFRIVGEDDGRLRMRAD